MTARIIVAFLLLPVSVFATNRYVDLAGGDVSPYLSWGNAATNIQDAVQVSSDGDTITIADGIYYQTNRCYKALTVQSQNGPENCIFDGSGTKPIFRFNFSSGVTIAGITFRNGYSFAGAGIYFGQSLATVSNCVFETCKGSGTYWGSTLGAGYSTVTVYGCTFTSNQGIYSIIGERGLQISDIYIDGCTFGWNDGGGVTIGIVGRGSTPGTDFILRNSIIYGSTCPVLRAKCENVTFAGCTGTINYNSTASNSVYINSPVMGAGTAIYSCSTNMIAGVGNVTNSPLVVDQDFYDANNLGGGAFVLGPSGVAGLALQETSPCVDVGLNNTWMVGAADYGGNARIYNTTVDMGAYEYTPGETASSSLVLWRAYKILTEGGLQ